MFCTIGAGSGNDDAVAAGVFFRMAKELQFFRIGKGRDSPVVPQITTASIPASICRASSFSSIRRLILPSSKGVTSAVQAPENNGFLIHITSMTSLCR